MPATNRDEVQLTPAPPDTSSSTLRDYLRSQLPSWASFQTALALLAVLLIVRSLVRRGYSWFSLRDRLQRPTRPAAGLPDQLSYQPCAQQLLPLQQQQQQPWAMEDEKAAARGKGIVGNMRAHHVRFDEEEHAGKRKTTTTLAIDPAWKNTAAANVVAGDSVPEPFISRPPPAPPLTPPELSTAVFTFLDRPHSASQESFIHQPNPDYMSSSTSTTSVSQPSSGSPSTPRRRSYNKTLPIGIPVPQRPSAASDADPADLTLSPSSYPPTSPLLPPAPPGLQMQHGDDGPPREIGVQGEIIGVLDGDGAGWTRHTRVYGGGVCLACAASGGNHLEGGFYGATVRPEEMR